MALNVLRRLGLPGALQQTKRRLQVVQNHLKTMSTQEQGETASVLMERIGSKGLITLNRPKALNSLNLEMIRRIYPQLKAWEEDPTTTMVIIKGAGNKAFCAGGDIVAVTADKETGIPLGKNFFKEEYILNNAIGTLHVPWIAMIDGVCMGGGVGLSVHGHYRIATERTMFAMPETGIGLFPDVGGGYFLPRLGGNLGAYLALTGFRLKGRDVQRAGVATHFVESSQIESLENELLSLKDPRPEDIDSLIQGRHMECQLGREKPFILQERMRDINRLFSGKTMEEIFSDLEKDGSDWAISQLETLQKMSPSSMKVTLKQIQRGARMTLQDVLQMEYRIARRHLENNDFFEGVRALLIDKDQKPKWDPPTIHKTADSHVESYFAALPPDEELIL